MKRIILASLFVIMAASTSLAPDQSSRLVQSAPEQSFRLVQTINQDDVMPHQPGEIEVVYVLVQPNKRCLVFRKFGSEAMKKHLSRLPSGSTVHYVLQQHEWPPPSSPTAKSFAALARFLGGKGISLVDDPRT